MYAGNLTGMAHGLLSHLQMNYRCWKVPLSLRSRKAPDLVSITKYRNSNWRGINPNIKAEF